MTVPKNPLQGHESFHYYKAGQFSAAEYIASGIPYATQSSATAGEPSKVEFPFVTKFFTVKNSGPGEMYIGFTANGVQGTNRFSLPESGSFTGDIRVKDLFFLASSGTGSFEVIAGMTGILRKDFFTLTGSFVGRSGSQEDFGYKGFGYNGIG